MNNRDYYFIKPYDDSLAKPPVESFSQILSEDFLHPFDWQARTTRRSYWWSVLINTILMILASIILGYAIGSNINLGLRWIDGVVAVVLYIYLFLANLGQLIRRMHDVNYSGYWYWLSFVPYGSFFLFYLTLQPSAQKPVKWGSYLFHEAEVYREVEEVKVPEPKFTQIIKEHFFDCFNWNARSTRTSFWVGAAISTLIDTIGIFILYFMFILAGNEHFPNLYEDLPTVVVTFIVILAIILAAVTIWSELALLGHTVRRLHDAGFIGWWWWISIIPYVGRLLLAFLLFHPTVNKEVKWNKYLFEDEDLR